MKHGIIYWRFIHDVAAACALAGLITKDYRVWMKNPICHDAIELADELVVLLKKGER